MRFNFLVVTILFLFSQTVFSEVLIKEVRVNKEVKILKNSIRLVHKVDPVPKDISIPNTKFTPVNSVMVTSQTILMVKNPDFTDCLSGTGLSGCSNMLVSSIGNAQDYSIDYGMFSVVGSGIRLPDEQLESVDGLEDESFFD